MKHTLILIILTLIVSVGFAQGKTDTALFKGIVSCDTCKYTAVFYKSDYFRSDTSKVLAYVCTDWNKAKFKWMHMYAVAKYGQYFNLSDLKIYSEYLMPDRKTKSIYKVIYSIIK